MSIADSYDNIESQRCFVYLLELHITDVFGSCLKHRYEKLEYFWESLVLDIQLS